MPPVTDSTTCGLPEEIRFLLASYRARFDPARPAGGRDRQRAAVLGRETVPALSLNDCPLTESMLGSRLPSGVGPRTGGGRDRRIEIAHDRQRRLLAEVGEDVVAQRRGTERMVQRRRHWGRLFGLAAALETSQYHCWSAA